MGGEYEERSPILPVRSLIPQASLLPAATSGLLPLPLQFAMPDRLIRAGDCSGRALRREDGA